MNEEKIQKDFKNRILGEKEYNDNLWINEFVSGSSYFSTSSATPVDITGMSISKTFSRETDCLILYSGQIDPEGTSAAVLVADIDGTPDFLELYGATIIAGGIIRSSHIPVTLGAGSHTIKLQLYSTSAGQTVAIYQRDLILVELHK